MEKSPDAFRTISEVAEWLDVPTHVLRFWESKFSQIKPIKRAGGRRYYRPSDMELIGGIKHLLHDEGQTIRAVQKVLSEHGVKYVAAQSKPLVSDAGEDVVDGTAVDVTEPAPAVAPPVQEEPAPPEADLIDLMAGQTGAEEPGAPDAAAPLDPIQNEPAAVEPAAAPPAPPPLVPAGPAIATRNAVPLPPARKPAEAEAPIAAQDAAPDPVAPPAPAADLPEPVASQAGQAIPGRLRRANPAALTRHRDALSGQLAALIALRDRISARADREGL